MNRYLIGLFLIILSFNSYGFDSLRVENSEGKSFVVHSVEPGETLYSLSKRYTSEIGSIVEKNNIVDNQISLGQELWIPIAYQASDEPTPSSTETRVHVVGTGETLYSISREYGVGIDQLKEWNGLASNEISIGQELTIAKNSTTSTTPKVVEEPLKVDKPKTDPIPNKPAAVSSEFTEYYVQSGDLLERIARKFNVRPDSIVIWNDLPNTYLNVGQKLLIKGELDPNAAKPNIKKTAYGSIRKETDASGFTKVYEEGVASKIDSSVETEKYLALHRTLSIGTLIEVRNLMNNKKVFVRVVGNLPETGINEKVLVRLTPICFERLGVIDPKTRVEVSYYLD